MTSVCFEVYGFSGGRWVFESRYDNDDREAAIDEARWLATTRAVDATKVIREEYDWRRGVGCEQTIFRTRPKCLRLNVKARPAVDEPLAVSESTSVKSVVAVTASDRSVATLRLRGGAMKTQNAAVLSSKLVAIATASFSVALLTTFLYLHATA